VRLAGIPALTLEPVFCFTLAACVRKMRASSFHYEERQPRDERVGLARSGSRDDGYSNNAHPHGQYMQQPHNHQYGYDRPTAKESFGIPPTRTHLGYAPPSSYSHQYPPRQLQSRPHRGLQAVVTSSFSEEESMRRMMAPDDRYETRERGHEMEREGMEERDDVYYHDYDRPISSNKHHHSSPANHHQYIQKSFSTGYQAKDAPLKRSYYHHSHPSEGELTPGQLPPDFMPPAVAHKRVKVGGSNRGEVIVTPRSHPQAEWFPQGSWEAEQEHYSRLTRHHSRSFPPPQNWTQVQQHNPANSPMRLGQEREIEPSRSKMSPIEERDYGHKATWQPAAQQWNGGPPRVVPSHNYRYWESKPEDAMDHSPRGSFDTNHHHQSPYYPTRSGSEDKMQLVVDAAAATGDHRPIHDSKEGLFLLALPQDRVSLSETLCVVREVRLNSAYG
jgi:hypothetical protein